MAVVDVGQKARQVLQVEDADAHLLSNHIDSDGLVGSGLGAHLGESFGKGLGSSLDDFRMECGLADLAALVASRLDFDGVQDVGEALCRNDRRMLVAEFLGGEERDVANVIDLDQVSLQMRLSNRSGPATREHGREEESCEKCDCESECAGVRWCWHWYWHCQWRWRWHWLGRRERHPVKIPNSIPRRP